MYTQELISKSAFLATTSTFFTLALTLATLRTLIRIFKNHRFFLDDYFFFLALACHITSTALVFTQLPNLYTFATLLSSSSSLPADFIQQAISQGATKILDEIWASEVLIWGTIFSVKFSFLCYFRNLVWQIENLRVLWFWTAGVLVAAACVSISSPWMVCPYVGEDILLRCVVTPDFLKREKIVLGCTVTFDILTDVMLICIPIRLLQQTRFRIQEKVKVGIVLCLSIVIIAISLVRAISFGVHGTIDQVWDEFWVQLESSISVIVVCMTAFRTLFVTSNPRNNNSPRTGWNWRKYRSPWSRDSSQFLPDIETGAMMTGMRTVIRENGRTMPGEVEESSSPQMAPWEYDSEAIVLKRPERILSLGGSYRPGVDTSPWGNEGN